jgi:hypothetical protein
MGHLENYEISEAKSSKGSIWSGIRESDPLLHLGKVAYYRCTNPASAC